MSPSGAADGRPRDVVVLGASLAGLFAAAAAAGAGRPVTVVERDVLPDGPAPRPGVAQGRQPHVFLHRGLSVLDRLLPGIRQELLDHGAVALNTGDLPWCADVGWTGLGEPGLEIVSATRPLFEHVVAQRVLALPGVRVVDGSRVQALDRVGGPAEATGHPGSADSPPVGEHGRRWAVHLEDGRTLEADLVVDASGRGSRMPAWLAAMRVDVPPPAEVDAGAGYATRMYAAAPADAGLPGVVVMATPQTRAGGMALRVEGDRYLVLASGYGDRRPPRDPEGYRAHFDLLADPAVADLVSAREPLGDVLVYRQTGNRRHHYEQVSDWPDGLVVLGDALCAFNPVYGQGITVAAIEAEELSRALRGSFGLRPGDSRRLMQRFSDVVDLPWAIATGADAAYVPARPARSPAALVQTVLGWWTREVGRLATHGNHRASATLGTVYHLTAPPSRLFHPALLLAAARGLLLGLPPAAARPTTIPGAATDRPG